ncbi:MAG: YlxR family protein [Firmicutes bacterium]|nr:YlxR family protein [Bacillota bacterium]MDD4336925.1 YlxR family protein [Bacillota bacterium]MDD4791806.1 YlxR family protein [Bacillota bacterium]
MAKVKKVPQRTCVGCGKVADKRDLIRVVRTPEGEVLVDPSGKRSGRGAYVCPNRDCLSKAARGGRLFRALETEASNEVIACLLEELPD